MFQKIINIILVVISLLFSFCKVQNIIEVDTDMELIEILSQNASNAAFFTVNTAVSFVPLAYSGGVDDGIMMDANGNEYFIPGDNYQMLSVGYHLPLSFEIYNVLNGATDENVKINMATNLRGGGVPPLILPEKLYIPFPNFELNFGVFYKSFGEEIKLNFQFLYTVNISMVNVPVALNGLVFRVPIFSKIKHNTFLIN